MRKLLLGLIMFTGALNAAAQCNELFISEYVEGNGNNKSLEIYNPGTGTVDLTQYRVTRWQNGAAVWTRQFSDTLIGSIGSNEVKVVVIDRRDTTKTGNDTPVALKLRLKADMFVSTVYTRSFAMNFNGDDALSLDKYDNASKIWKPIDIFGKIGEQPQLPSNPNRTIGWSDSFPFNRGLGLWWTINHTMIRKRTVTRGVNTNPSYFDPRKEWMLYPNDMFDSLRTHNCDCNKFAAGVRNESSNNLELFPNPASEETMAFLESDAAAVLLTDITGRALTADYSIERTNGYAILRLRTAALKPGVYQLSVYGNRGEIRTARIIRP